MSIRQDKSLFMKRLTRAMLAVFGISLFVIPATGANAQGFNFADRFNNAIEAVQEGIDIIWPGDLDSENINARFGVGFGLVPDYVGSDSYRFRAVPIIDVRYQDKWRVNGGKISYVAFKGGQFEAGPLVNLHFGRKESANKDLEGLGTIHTTLDVGLYARIKSDRLLVDIDARQALGAGQGLAIRLIAGHGFYRSENFAAGAGIRARYLSKKGMQTNFGITERQAMNSSEGYDIFETNAGVSEVSANVIGAYRLTEKTRLFGVVSVGSLLGDAADSPLVASGRGSDLQVITGAALVFKF